MQPIKTRARRVIHTMGKWLQLESHDVQFPDGRIVEDWPWIISPDYINVAVTTPEGKFVVFRQTKYAVDGVSLAPVGGYIEPGEDPLVCAKRELLEEMGMASDDWVSLGQQVVDANRGIATGHFYLARNARRIADPIADDYEEQQFLVLSRAEIESALSRGEFKVLSWSYVMLAALQHV